MQSNEEKKGIFFMCKGNKIYTIGMIFIIVFINFPEIYGKELYEHPDTTNREIIFDNLSISETSGLEHVQLETFLLQFWFYEMAFKLIWVATGVIVFCFIFICKGFFRLFRHGVI
jgi:hypothetical protein